MINLLVIQILSQTVNCIIHHVPKMQPQFKTMIRRMGKLTDYTEVYPNEEIDFKFVKLLSFVRFEFQIEYS